MSQQTVHLGRTVNDVIVEYPKSVTGLQRHGRGRVLRRRGTLDAAAREAGDATAELLAALRITLGRAAVPVETDEPASTTTEAA